MTVLVSVEWEHPEVCFWQGLPRHLQLAPSTSQCEFYRVWLTFLAPVAVAVQLVRQRLERSRPEVNSVA